MVKEKPYFKQVNLTYCINMKRCTDDFLVNKIEFYAFNNPEKIALKFINNDFKTIEEITYLELYQKVSFLANKIKETAQNKPILLIFDAGLDYIISFLATLFSHHIAVTAIPPRKTRHMERLTKIIKNSDTCLMLTHSTIKSYCLNNKLDFAFNTEIICIDEIVWDKKSDFIIPSFKADDIAFLQYTSGSTGSPKGVMVTHGNISANLKLIATSLNPDFLKICVSWLPIFHDMGLIGCTLLPLYYGNTAIFMAPTTFLKDPAFWLESISKHQATYTMAPNFSYDLAIDSLLKKENLDLDFSHVHHLVNGAEPIKPSTIHRTEEFLKPWGLNSGAMKLGYGMAETTLNVAVHFHETNSRIVPFSSAALEKGTIEAPENKDDVTELVSCGIIDKHYNAKIVDPETQKPLAQGQIGEIWLQGNSVTAGYYNDPEKTKEIFNAYTRDDNEGPFLRTGDVGAIAPNQHLIICGRLKDLMIINGRNIYPQDIEKACYESHTALVNDSAAAFSIKVEGYEVCILMAEVQKHLSEEIYTEIMSTIKKAVFEEASIIPYDIVLIPPHFISKTSSGKIQRAACKMNFLANKFHLLARLKKSRESTPQIQFKQKTTSIKNNPIQEWLIQWVVIHCEINISDISIDAQLAFTEAGLDSIKQITLINDLEKLIQHPIEPWFIWQHPTIQSLSEALNTELKSHEACALYDKIESLLIQKPIISAPNDNFISQEHSKEQTIIASGQASTLQINLLSLIKKCPNESPYAIPLLCKIASGYELGKLQQALQYSINTIPALRTAFKENSDELEYVIYREAHCEIEIINTQNILNTIGNLLMKPINIESPPLIHAHLIKTEGQPDYLLIKIHHLIMDGLSAELFLRKLENNYFRPPESPISIEEQNYIHSYSEDEKAYPSALKNNSDYYQQLKEAIAPLTINEENKFSEFGKLYYTKLSVDQTKKIRFFCKEQAISSYTLYLYLFCKAISEHYCTPDIYISIVKSNRAKLVTPTTLGYFADNIPLLININSQENFLQQLHQIQRIILQITMKYEHTIKTIDLEKTGYQQPNFIFNHYQLVEDMNLLYPDDSMLIENIIQQPEQVPLWNYRSPEKLNLMVRSSLKGDCISLIYNPVSISKNEATKLWSTFIQKIMEL